MQQSILRSEVLKITVYLVSTMLLGAILAPPLFLSCKWVVAQGWLEGGPLDSLNAALERSKFSRYFNRAMMLSAILMIYPTIRWIRSGINNTDRLRNNIALQSNPHRWK